VTKEDKDIWECVAKYDDGNVNIATLPSKKEEKRIRVSRSDITTSLLLSRLQKDATKDGVQSLGASYTHMDSLKGIVGAQTTRIVMYHAMLDSLEGLDKTTALDIAYLGFNRIRKFRAEDAKIPQINVLDLAGNPLQSLVNCPPCKELIVSSCWLEDLKGCPETVEILRCGHSLTLKSLSGLPKSVRILECSCTPHLNIDDSMNTFLTLHQIKVIREASYVVQK
jgi:hypothetical protein